MQFYFLAILLNLLCSIIFLYATDFFDGTASLQDDLDLQDLERTQDAQQTAGVAPTKKMQITQKQEQFALLDSTTFRLVVAVCSAFCGFVKLFFPYSSNSSRVVFFGDFFVAVSLFLASFVLCFEYYAAKQQGFDIDSCNVVIKTICTSKKYIGIFCLATAALHFLLPKVLFF